MCIDMNSESLHYENKNYLHSIRESQHSQLPLNQQLLEATMFVGKFKSEKYIFNGERNKSLEINCWNQLALFRNSFVTCVRIKDGLIVMCNFLLNH